MKGNGTIVLNDTFASMLPVRKTKERMAREEKT
jgi:hypothetical protein